MTRTFPCRIGGDLTHVNAHTGPERVTVSMLAGSAASISMTMNPREARALANALYQAADHAENTLATGLGESVAA